MLESQNVFVEGRQILDAVVIANEATNLRLSLKNGLKFKWNEPKLRIKVGLKI